MLTIKLKGVANELLRVRQEVFKKASIEKQVSALSAALEQATPVDTGFAKSSWRVTKGNDKNFSIVNDAPYIQHLNEGSSTQAPSHFVESIAMQYGTPVGSIVEVT